MIAEGRHLLRENLTNTDPPPCKAPIANLFSLVTPQQKSSINTINKFPTRFSVSLRLIVFVDPKPPKGALKHTVS